MVEPKFSIEEVDKQIDRIRVARVEAEIEVKKQQIDHPAVEMIHTLRAKNTKLEEALRECVHQIECVRDYYPIHPIDQPKLAYALRQAREVLGDA